MHRRHALSFSGSGNRRALTLSLGQKSRQASAPSGRAGYCERATSRRRQLSPKCAQGRKARLGHLNVSIRNVLRDMVPRRGPGKTCILSSENKDLPDALRMFLYHRIVFLSSPAMPPITQLDEDHWKFRGAKSYGERPMLRCKNVRGHQHLAMRGVPPIPPVLRADRRGTQAA